MHKSIILKLEAEGKVTKIPEEVVLRAQDRINTSMRDYEIKYRTKRNPRKLYF